MLDTKPFPRTGVQTTFEKIQPTIFRAMTKTNERGIFGHKDQNTRQSLEIAFMLDWCSEARAMGIRQLGHMAKTLLHHARGILSYYRTKLTSAKV